MFERFSVDARAAVVDAQEIARRRGDRSIDTVHLLLAVAENPDGAAVRALLAVGVDPAGIDAPDAPVDSTDDLDDAALAALGIDLTAVRARTDAAFGPGSLDRAGREARPGRRGHVPFTKDAKKTLELALREAVRAGSRSIDSGDVLLGLARDTGTTAYRALATALTEAGSDVGQLRVAVAEQRRKAS